MPLIVTVLPLTVPLSHAGRPLIVTGPVKSPASVSVLLYAVPTVPVADNSPVMRKVGSARRRANMKP
ncbi:hypothetical protein RLIN73S_02755 [Rhodanobacter lindaniclasticus]